MSILSSFMGGGLTSGVTAIASDVVQGMVGAAMNPVVRDLHYAANRVPGIRLLIPDIAALMRGYVTRKVSYQTVKDYARWHGIDLDDPLWQSVLDNQKSWPALDLLLRAKRRGLLPAEQFFPLAARHGVVDDTAWHLTTNQPWPWTPDQVRRIATANKWPAERYDAWLKSAGLPLAEDRDVFAKLFTPPTPAEVLTLWNRKEISAELADEWLTLNGLTNKEAREEFAALRHSVPSASDLTRFSVKEVWNGAVVSELGYDDEFDQIPAFKEWMDRQGYGGSPKIEGLGDGQPETWAQAYWRAHWATISNTQAYTMLHRLRPTGGLQGGPPGSGTEQPRVPDVGGRPIKPVTIDTVNTVLKINDYPPAWRERLAAVSYLPLRLVDINRIVYLCLTDEDFAAKTLPAGWTVEQWAAEEFMDRGQTRRQADLLAHLAVRRAERTRHTEILREGRLVRTGRTGLVLRQYASGTFTRDDAVLRFDQLRVSRALSQAWLNMEDAKKRLSDIKFQVGWMQRQYLKGRLSEEEATSLLRRIGLVDSEVSRYINRWRFDLDAGLKSQITAEILREYHHGRISREAAVRRLENLGWVHAETLLAESDAESSTS